jgi:hypothetical protein
MERLPGTMSRGDEVLTARPGFLIRTRYGLLQDSTCFTQVLDEDV